MSDRRELSVRLHDILEMVGASERMRRFHQHTATTLEILNMATEMILASELSNFYRCGSSYEGTVTPDLASDEDVIICNSSISVVPNRCMAGPGRCVLIVRESWTRPGYVKLQYMTDRRPDTVDTVGEACGDCKVCAYRAFDQAGRACLKISDEDMHGPAKWEFNSYGWHYLDKVMALKCRGIPLFAIAWINRQRRHEWPSQQQINEMKGMGCLFVRAGYFNSPERHLEWRLSFSLQERMLMKNLLSVQHKVYILLKMVKKDVLEKRLKVESLTSYHCKTCVFYMAETTPAHFWTPDNLIACLLQCLKLLLDWVKGRFCPSFFLKDQNLFDKEGFSDIVGPLERLIDSLLQTGHEFLYMIQSDRVGEILRGGNLRLYSPISVTRLNRYIVDWKLHVLSSAEHRVKELHVLSERSKYDTASYFMPHLEKIQQGDFYIPGHTKETIKGALQYMLPWLHFAIGMALATRAVTCNSKREGKELMKQADCHFNQARTADFASVKLAQATILLKTGKLEECFLLLQELESHWTYRVKTPCSRRCKTVTFCDRKRENGILSQLRDMPMGKLRRKYTSQSMSFFLSQIDLVPPPLCFELVRFIGTPSGYKPEGELECASVDAKVYLYLLQYLVSSKLNRCRETQIAIDNLAALVLHDVIQHGEVLRPDTAYNLLGWIYFQENRVEDAVWCFVLSWKITPDHNAAKLHLLDMAFKMAQARSSTVPSPDRPAYC